MKSIILTILLCSATFALAVPDEVSQKFELEFAGAAHFAQKRIENDDEIDMPKINTYGVEATSVLNIDEKHAITLRVGYASADESVYWNDGMYIYTFNIDMKQLYLMPGYRYTAQLNERSCVFFGVNAGILQQTVELSWWGVRLQEKAVGFACSAEVGVTYALSKNTSFYVTGGFLNSQTRCDFEGEKTNAQQYFSLRGGVSFSF